MHNGNGFLPDPVSKGHREALMNPDAHYLYPVRDVVVGETVVPYRNDYYKSHGGRPKWHVGSVPSRGSRVFTVVEVRDDNDSPLVDEIVVREPRDDGTGAVDGSGIGRCPDCGQLVDFIANCWRCNGSLDPGEEIPEPGFVPRRGIIDDARDTSADNSRSDAQ